ncbi:MAG: NTP transferase domain-containing protein [Pseudomonadota bacterium]|nr:NTP transferase domain-containing protein [Pseudomonadota bacterium]|tara:strand:+ start:798 stop:1484 length:687 start_codon:yes stop_codon:yes gene_type:complete
MKVPAIIFSRMGSSRLPGKALRHIAGEPLIKRVIDRVSKVKNLSTIVVATSNSKTDDRLTQYIQSLNIEVFRGATHDVLNRAVSCASYLGVDKFVRINGDSPLIDPELLEKGIEMWTDPSLDLISNVFPRTYPVGMSVEIIKTDSLKKIMGLTADSCDSEHVTRFFYKNPEKFRILNFESGRSELREVRLAVDTEEDLERIDWLFKEFGGLINFEMAAEKSSLWSSVE